MPKILAVLDILFFPSPSLDIVRIIRAEVYFSLSLYTGTYVYNYLENFENNLLKNT
jgi:hypothetical protein